MIGHGNFILLSEFSSNLSRLLKRANDIGGVYITTNVVSEIDLAEAMHQTSLFNVSYLCVLYFHVIFHRCLLDFVILCFNFRLSYRRAYFYTSKSKSLKNQIAVRFCAKKGMN